MARCSTCISGYMSKAVWLARLMSRSSTLHYSLQLIANARKASFISLYENSGSLSRLQVPRSLIMRVMTSEKSALTVSDSGDVSIRLVSKVLINLARKVLLW